MSEQVDYFTLFALPRRYALERPALETAYERLTLAHHPDFFATAPEAERQQAGRLSAQVNEGYRVLRNDLARSEHLLALLANGRKLDAQALPPGFLQAMFSLQEELEELEDGAHPQRRDALRREVDGQLETARVERAQLFASVVEKQAQPQAAASLQAIQSNLNCERYLQRLLARLNGERDD